MQSGGADPAIVARMIDLQAEAQSLEKNKPAAAGKSKTPRVRLSLRVMMNRKYVVLVTE